MKDRTTGRISQAPFRPPSAWMQSKGYPLNYVFADYESPAANDNCLATVALVRSSPDPQINQAMVGNYGYYPGAYNLTGGNGAVDQTQADAFYRSSGMNAAMPNAYDYSSYISLSDSTSGWGSANWWNSTWNSSYLTPNQQAAIGGSYLSPNQRAALFYGPLELVSLAARSLPVGDELIPYVSDLLPYNGATVAAGQDPTEADYEALIIHYRLRGAAGIYTFPGGTIDYTTYRNDVLTAWTSLDWFFNLPTSVVTSGGTITADAPLNLDTFKSCNGTYVDPNGLNGGIEWSGYQRGNRIVAIVSNLGNGNQATYWTLNTINANLPSLSPVVPMGGHAVLQYLSDPTFDNFESSNARTLYGPNAAYFQQAQGVVAGQGNTSSGALGLTSSALTGTTSSMWYQAGNPGGLLSTDLMVYGGEMYFSGSGTITNGATLASFEPVTIGSYELSHTASAVAAADEGPKLSFVGSSTSTIAVEFRATFSAGDTYLATNLTPGRNKWYAFDILVNPTSGTSGTGEVFYKDLTGTSDWTELVFDDLTTGGTATSVPLLLSEATTTTTFNGWEVSGVGGAQLDDLSMQLYPYLNTMGYTLSDPMQSAGLTEATGLTVAQPLVSAVEGRASTAVVPEPSGWHYWPRRSWPRPALLASGGALSRAVSSSLTQAPAI